MRRVRSFVRRQGRMTDAQRQLLERLWPRYGIANGTALLDLDGIFGRQAARVVEIGFGMGDSLLEMAEAAPEQNFLGIEVHRPGIARLLRSIDERHITNIRIICDDAVEVLRHRIAVDSLSALHLYFPDPWPKKRHHKRRIIQPDFVALIAGRLSSGGVFHMATDWEDYALTAMNIISACPNLRNRFGDHCFAPRPRERPQTKFERRGHRLGHGVWDLLFEKR